MTGSTAGVTGTSRHPRAQRPRPGRGPRPDRADGGLGRRRRGRVRPSVRARRGRPRPVLPHRQAAATPTSPSPMRVSPPARSWSRSPAPRRPAPAALAGAPTPARRAGPGAGRLSLLWFCTAAAAALLAGWFAAHQESSDRRAVTIGLLVLAAVLGCLPIGRFAAHRVLTAPVFAGAAAFAIAWDPEPARLPTILGVAGLAAAVAAAVGRALDEYSEEALRVWMIVGTSVFLVTGGRGARRRASAGGVGGAAADRDAGRTIRADARGRGAGPVPDRPRAAGGDGLVGARAPEGASRPDPRTPARGRDGRRQRHPDGHRRLGRGAGGRRGLSAPLLLADATFSMDRIGARCLVGFAGAALLLAARSYRHAAARALLRTAGSGLLGGAAVVVFDAGGTTYRGVRRGRCGVRSRSSC